MYEEICQDVLFRHREEKGPVHAQRNGRKFVLMVSGGEEKGWVVEIEERKTA